VEEKSSGIGIFLIGAVAGAVAGYMVRGMRTTSRATSGLGRTPARPRSLGRIAPDMPPRRPRRPRRVRRARPRHLNGGCTSCQAAR
jgi:hypothetical protein